MISADALFTNFAPTNSSGIIDATGATGNVAGIPYGNMKGLISAFPLPSPSLSRLSVG